MRISSPSQCHTLSITSDISPFHLGALQLHIAQRVGHEVDLCGGKIFGDQCSLRHKPSETVCLHRIQRTKASSISPLSDHRIAA